MRFSASRLLPLNRQLIRGRSLSKRRLSSLVVVILLVLLLLILLLVNVHVLYHGSNTRAVMKELTNKSSVATSVRAFPSCLVIGVRKGGTRALLEMLRLHSHIRVAPHETHYFDRNFESGMEWYRSQMPWVAVNLSDTMVVVEKTPSYFVSDQAVHRVHAFDPHMRLVLVVREPVARLVSDFAQLVRKRGSQMANLSLVEVLFDENNRIRSDHELIDRSLYAKHVSKWLRLFKRTQLLVLSAERLVRAPWIELARVESFLRLQHQLTRSKFYFSNKKGFFCINIDSDIDNKNETKGCLRSDKGRTHPQVDEQHLSHLRRFFAPFNFQFYDKVQADFGWPEA